MRDHAYTTAGTLLAFCTGRCNHTVRLFKSRTPPEPEESQVTVAETILFSPPVHRHIPLICLSQKLHHQFTLLQLLT